MSTVVRRRRNSIDAVKTDAGVWLHQREAIGSHIQSHFERLFARTNTQYPRDLNGLIPELITETDNAMLCSVPDDLEIWRAVRSLGSTKAPGRMVLQPYFIRKYWGVVKMEVIKIVRSFFENEYLLRQMNCLNIVLIPNLENPSSIGQFRPISLCNVNYKIISKILSFRLNVVLPKLIFGNQNAFVSGPSIQENIILVHELMHTLKRKQGRGGLMAAKIDMEKTYNNWIGIFFWKF